MDSGMYAACAGLVARAEAVDTLANNLANVNTTGFRARHNTFSSVLASTGSQSRLSMLNQDANDYGMLSGNRLDTTQGILQPTNNPLDLAIDGPGYFPVQTATGTAYTRAGDFRVNGSRQLTTAQGDPVLGEGGPITIVGSPVSIGSDGTISVNGALAGKLKVVDFPANVEPKSQGAAYFTVPDGTAVTPSTKSSIHQGALEASNVNPITSVVELMGAQSDLESMRRALSLMSSEMDKTASQDIPRVS